MLLIYAEEGVKFKNSGLNLLVKILGGKLIMNNPSGQSNSINVEAIVDAIIQTMTAGNMGVSFQFFPSYAVVTGIHQAEGILEYRVLPDGVAGPNPSEELGYKTSIDAVRANIGDELHLHDMVYDPAAQKFVPSPNNY